MVISGILAQASPHETGQYRRYELVELLSG